MTVIQPPSLVSPGATEHPNSPIDLPRTDYREHASDEADINAPDVIVHIHGGSAGGGLALTTATGMCAGESVNDPRVSPLFADLATFLVPGF